MTDHISGLEQEAQLMLTNLSDQHWLTSLTTIDPAGIVLTLPNSTLALTSHDPNYHQNLIVSSLASVLPFRRIL